MSASVAAITTAGELIMLPLAELQESPKNPRKRFPAQSLNELAESIRKSGVLVPLTVRPCPGGYYEIAAGHRRYRAAKLAGLEEVPAIVRAMDDLTFLEAVTIDNLQREDIHPLEEATGYQELLKHYDVATIAQKIGKSASYVYLTAGHAVQIARLDPKHQKEALQICDQGNFSVRDLAAWIDREIHLDLSKAPFESSDPALHPEGPWPWPACEVCPKRAGNSPLYPDKAPNTCTDRSCYQAKVKAFIGLRLSELKAKHGEVLQLSTDGYYSYNGEKRLPGVLYRSEYEVVSQPRCSSAKVALVMHGWEKLGHTLTVCTDKKCRMHLGRFAPSEGDVKRRRQTELQQKQKREVASRTLEDALDRVTAPISRQVLRLVTFQLYRQAHADTRKLLCARNGVAPVEVSKPYKHTDYDGPMAKYIDSLNGEHCFRMLVEIAAAPELGHPEYFVDGAAILPKLTAALKVDTAAIAREVAAEFAAKTARKGGK